MSQRDHEQTIIDELKIDVYMLPPKQARTMLLEMTKIVAPLLGALGDMRGGLRGLLATELNDISTDRFQQLAVLLSDKLDPKMIDAHMNALAEVTQVDGVTLSKTFDLTFRGKLGTMFKWYGFALKVNFADFMGALGNAQSLLPEPKAKG